LSGYGLSVTEVARQAVVLGPFVAIRLYFHNLDLQLSLTELSRPDPPDVPPQHQHTRLVDHTTIFCWVQRYAPEIEKRVRWYQGYRSSSWRIDEPMFASVVRGNTCSVPSIRQVG